MLIPRLIASIFWVGLMMLGSGAVSGQNYPHKPVRIVTGVPGATLDVVARLIAQGISGPLGQAVIVENRPSGVILGEIVAKAPPDGYTLLLDGSALWLLPFMRDNMPFDPVRDFSPITLATTAPNILVVHPSVPAKSVKELIALAKARPGELNYASGTTGTSSHLAGELFKAMAGVNIVRVPYKGFGQALIPLIGGEVHVAFGSAGSVTLHVKSGRLRALAVTSAEPSALAPGLPTVAAAGLPGYKSATPFGIFAPAGTPAALINRLSQEMARVLNTPAVKERLLGIGVEAVGSSPEAFAAALKSEMATMGKLIKDLGLRDE